MDTRTVITVDTAARPTALAASADARLDQECAARLNWLLRANEQAAQHRRRFRNAREEEEMMLMRHPLSARRAFAFYGMLTGTLPPAAIFYKSFGWANVASETWLLLICVLMSVACAATGYWFGGVLSQSLADLKRKGWHRALLGALWLGAVWGACAGALGGLVFFGIGAVFGATYGLLGGALAFALFTPLHRLLSRGDMIDARHFWPVACGITAALAALIVNL